MDMAMRSDYLSAMCTGTVILVSPFSVAITTAGQEKERCEGVLYLIYLQVYTLSTATMPGFDLKHKPQSMGSCHSDTDSFST